MVGSVVAALPTSSDRESWSADEAAVIEAAGLVFTHAYGDRKGERTLAPRPIVARFLHTCERTGLDPLARQIYCIGRFGTDGLEWSIQTGIDGFRLIAERSGQYAGQDPAQWLTEAGEWVSVFIKAKHGAHPLAARVAVYRHDWDRPAVGIATWEEYAQTKRNGDLTAMWVQRGPGQLAKCAEALSLRKAFPQDLSGLYTDDELAASHDREADQEQPARRPKQLQTAASRMRAASEPAEDTTAPEPDSVAPTGRVAPEETASEGDVELFPCSRCGDLVVEEAGQICEPCEIAVEQEIAGVES